MRGGACAHAGLLGSGLERGVARVVGTEPLADARAVRSHASEVHSVAALAQLVVDGPVGAVVLTGAVPVPVGEPSGDRVPVGPRDHAVPVGHVALALAGVSVPIRMRVHAHAAVVGAAVDMAPKLDRVHRFPKGDGRSTHLRVG
jgi:hypothetical protein